MFSEDPALYRWQCWASTYKDPNSKDPTFVEDPRVRIPDGKVSFFAALFVFDIVVLVIKNLHDM